MTPWIDFATRSVLHSFVDLATARDLHSSWDFDPEYVFSRTSFIVTQLCSCDLKSVLRAERRAGRGIEDARARRWLAGVLGAVHRGEAISWGCDCDRCRAT